MVFDPKKGEAIMTLAVLSDEKRTTESTCVRCCAVNLEFFEMKRGLP